MVVPSEIVAVNLLLANSLSFGLISILYEPALKAKDAGEVVVSIHASDSELLELSFG